MTFPHIAGGDRIVDPMIALAGCSTQQRIVVAGSSMELMLELHRRGYLRAAQRATAADRPVSMMSRLSIGVGVRSALSKPHWTGL